MAGRCSRGVAKAVRWRQRRRVNVGQKAAIKPSGEVADSARLGLVLLDHQLLVGDFAHRQHLRESTRLQSRDHEPVSTEYFFAYSTTYLKGNLPAPKLH